MTDLYKYRVSQNYYYHRNHQILIIYSLAVSRRFVHTWKYSHLLADIEKSLVMLRNFRRVLCQGDLTSRAWVEAPSP